jgi:hypothetical protein
VTDTKIREFQITQCLFPCLSKYLKCTFFSHRFFVITVMFLLWLHLDQVNFQTIYRWPKNRCCCLEANIELYLLACMMLGHAHVSPHSFKIRLYLRQLNVIFGVKMTMNAWFLTISRYFSLSSILFAQIRPFC